MDVFKEASTGPMSKCDTVRPLNSTTLLTTFHNDKIKSRKSCGVKSNWICQHLSERTWYVVNLDGNLSPNQKKLEVTKETQEKLKPSEVHGDMGSTLCRASRCSLRVQEMYFFGFTAALKIFCLTKGLPTASTNTENVATQRSDRPRTQKKKKTNLRPTNPPTLQIPAHRRKEQCSACIKVHEGFGQQPLCSSPFGPHRQGRLLENFYDPCKRWPRNASVLWGAPWTTFRNPQIEKLLKDSSEIPAVKMYPVLGKKRLFALLLDSPSV